VSPMFRAFTGGLSMVISRTPSSRVSRMGTTPPYFLAMTQEP
jgi:hypothetical protein